MTSYQVYVRGHGGEEKQMLPPAENLPISMITIGQFGSTMSDQVADDCIYGHFDFSQIQTEISNEVFIYWTKAERDDWYENNILNYASPSLDITEYDNINQNLALDGDDDIGDCGVCYWDENQGKLIWLIRLEHKQTILLTDILDLLKQMLQAGDSIELYWTACMSAQYWYGKNKKVSINPTKK